MERGGVEGWRRIGEEGRMRGGEEGREERRRRGGGKVVWRGDWVEDRAREDPPELLVLFRLLLLELPTL